MDTKALRQKILDLAIHGKLVPQDPNDEPASVLLERIRAEKERLIKEGKIKKGKKSAKTSDKPHYPYELPKGWKWCKLGDIAYVGTGATPLTTCKYYYENGNIAWINSSSTKVPFIAKASNFITRKAIEETNCLVYPKGTLVIAMYGEGKTRGQISELLIDAATNQACAAVCPYFEATKEYLKLFFEGNYLHIRALAEGGNQPNLSLGKIQNYEIPLPPLDEQKRILEQAKKLLLQVENIEKEKEKNKNSIKQAKAKILNLAIHGKLVPQDPNDESASELLKRINPKAEIISDNGHYQKIVPFEVPNKWKWCKLKDICTFLSRGKSPKYKDEDGTYPVFAQKCNLKDGGISLEQARFLDPDTLERWDEKYKLRNGDVLINSTGTGTVGRTRLFTEDCLDKYPFVVPDSHVSVVRTHVDVVSEFVYSYISSAHIQQYIEDNLTGSTNQKELYVGVLEEMDFPLPPLTEQKRIVSKIRSIFAQLDTIVATL